MKFPAIKLVVSPVLAFSLFITLIVPSVPLGLSPSPGPWENATVMFKAGAGSRKVIPGAGRITTIRGEEFRVSESVKAVDLGRRQLRKSGFTLSSPEFNRFPGMMSLPPPPAD